jgi:CRP-like cAMP-binding protein
MNAMHDYRLIEGVISCLPVFGGASRESLHAAARRCWTLPAPRGHTLVRAGTRPPGIFAVAYGSLKLSLRNGGAEERVLRLVSARHMFGEAPALLGRPSPYEAVALLDSKVVVIPAATVLALMERDTAFARTLLMKLAERELDLCNGLGLVTLRSGVQRLAAYLAELGGADVPPPSTVHLPFSKTLLAACLGIKKETLSRLLRQLAAEGVIRVRRREITILDRGRLLVLAG